MCVPITVYKMTKRIQLIELMQPVELGFGVGCLAKPSLCHGRDFQRIVGDFWLAKQSWRLCVVQKKEMR